MAEKRLELRRDPITGDVVVISSNRQKTLEQLRRQNSRNWLSKRTNPTIVSGQECPFEEGNEKMTPPEFRSYRTPGTQENEPGWWVRVIPNLNPAVESSVPSERLAVEKQGPYLMTGAYGYHYVIVETLEHNGSLATVTPGQVREVLHMWRDLTYLVGSDRNIKYVFFFENYGPLAGASQPHPHSQLIALPMVPPVVNSEFRGAERYFEEESRCFYCDERDWELRSRERLIEETERFFAWCPYTSKTPYQVTISPKEHQSYFANLATYPDNADPLTEFADLLQRILRRLRNVLNDPDYSLCLHTGPTDQPEMEAFHWHLLIEPVTEAVVAGFEKGSGAYINPRSPESAAEDLRQTETS